MRPLRGGVLGFLALIGVCPSAVGQARHRPVPPSSAYDSSARRVTPEPSTTPSGWDVTAEALAVHPGLRYNFWCPPGGRASPVWGDQIYTSDSSICTAAVHGGNFSLLSGGNAIIEMRPGQRSYAASRRNGIATSARGAWKASFVLVNPS